MDGASPTRPPTSRRSPTSSASTASECRAVRAAARRTPRSRSRATCSGSARESLPQGQARRRKPLSSYTRRTGVPHRGVLRSHFWLEERVPAGATPTRIAPGSRPTSSRAPLWTVHLLLSVTDVALRAAVGTVLALAAVKRVLALGAVELVAARFAV